jgi:hypothetical protein
MKEKLHAYAHDFNSFAEGVISFRTASMTYCTISATSTSTIETIYQTRRKAADNFKQTMRIVLTTFCGLGTIVPFLTRQLFNSNY